MEQFYLGCLAFSMIFNLASYISLHIVNKDNGRLSEWKLEQMRKENKRMADKPDERCQKCRAPGHPIYMCVDHEYLLTEIGTQEYSEL